MLHRLGPGPVFIYDSIIASRRWQMYAGRSLFIAVILTGLIIVWAVETENSPLRTFQSLADIGETFFYAMVSIQLSIVMLVAPALTASSIALDKSRGTLAHMLVTDLTSWEIILGKLGSRLIPLLGLVCATLPVTLVGTLLGGMDPEALIGALMVTLGVGFLTTTLTLTFSVWGRKTYEVMLVSYLLISVWLLLYPIWTLLGWSGALSEIEKVFAYLTIGEITLSDYYMDFLYWIDVSNPFSLALAPYTRPLSTQFSTYWGFLGGCVGVSTALSCLSIWRLRKVYARQQGKSQSEKKTKKKWFVMPNLTRFLPGPSLSGNPILWREWHKSGPSRWTRFVWLFYIVGVTVFTIGSVGYVFSGANLGPGGGVVAVVLINGFHLALGLLLASLSAATTIPEERANGTLDIIMSTPLTTLSILWGKWWGAYRKIILIAIPPAILSTACALVEPKGILNGALVVILVLAYGAAMVSLGLALGTWLTRFHRAVVSTIFIYALISVGWFFLVVSTVNSNEYGPGLASASPWWGISYQTINTVDPGEFGGTAKTVMFGCAWAALYTAASFILMIATLLSFDRYAGRAGRGRLFISPRQRQLGALSVLDESYSVYDLERAQPNETNVLPSDS